MAQSTSLDQIQQVQEDEYVFPYHYMDIADEWHRKIAFLHYYARLNCAKELLGPYTGQRILDAGCGDGRFCYELRKENVHLMGIDYSERALAFARAFVPGVEFVCGDLRELQVDERFDGCAMIETLEHIPPPEIESVLLGLRRLLKPGARLVITVPSVTIPIIDKHYQHFSEESLRKTLEGVFDVEQVLGLDQDNPWRAKYDKCVRMAGRLGPFRRKFKSLPDYIERARMIYKEHLERGPAATARNLVANCRNRD